MQSHRFKLASLACVIALCGCGADHAGRDAGKVASISDFRMQTVGTWCFLDKLAGRMMKMEISSAGQYILEYAPVNSGISAGWKQITRGVVEYGEGWYSEDGSKYYYAHLNGTTTNFGVSTDIPVTAVLKQGMPVLIRYDEKQGPELQTQYITRNCKLNLIGSGLNPSGHP